jgi:enamine deaminase RidA (YjgF/YER057c/UK114 family)
MLKTLAPKDWLAPKGYANGIVAEGRQVYVAGQIGWDSQHCFVGDDFVAQAEQALRNIVAVLAEAGGKPEHVVRMTWYVVDKAEYLEAGRGLGAAYRRVFGKHFPAMSAVQVVALMEDKARVEIEATAVLPNP